MNNSFISICPECRAGEPGIEPDCDYCKGQGVVEYEFKWDIEDFIDG